VRKARWTFSSINSKLQRPLFGANSRSVLEHDASRSVREVASRVKHARATGTLKDGLVANMYYTPASGMRIEEDLELKLGLVMRPGFCQQWVPETGITSCRGSNVSIGFRGMIQNPLTIQSHASTGKRRS
jgi:hypothetical protein